MTDSRKPNLEDRIDRYARSELTAAEARELAQASLDSPELFEELTWSAVAKTGLPSATSSKVVPFPRKVWFFIAAAAAALLLISFYTVRPFLSTRKSADISQAKPSLPFSARSGQPLLLASGLDPVRPDPTVFRSPTPDSRAPQAKGLILSFEDGMATIGLGSLDYIEKGAELQIFPDDRATQPVGRMVVTTVFRESARGQVLDGLKIPIHSEVRVPGVLYLAALLEQVDALTNRGDLPAARSKAEEAQKWAENANVPLGDKGKALEKLARLEYQTGLFPAAEKHFQSAADNLATAPLTEQSAAWNNLAVIRLATGDYPGAEAPLNQAVSKSPRTDIVYARSLNNLGVLTELRGDPHKAESLYTDAMRTFDSIANAPAQERQAVETNLKRLKGLH
jgi:tetratricopeptide (TPR) repeat protein